MNSLMNRLGRVLAIAAVLLLAAACTNGAAPGTMPAALTTDARTPTSTPVASPTPTAAPIATMTATPAPPPPTTPFARTGIGLELDAYVSEFVESGRFSGSVLVARDGKLLFSKGYGMADRQQGVPNRPNTRFRLGSLTKQFTALAIMQLQEKGLLNVGDPIGTYLPDYPNGDRITIHHLLTHTSGIPDYTGIPEAIETKAAASSVEEIVDTFRDRPLEFTPGVLFSYTNSGYVLLGDIIERVSGESYESYLQENIFRPLGMLDTGIDRNDSPLRNRASGYAVDAFADAFPIWSPDGGRIAFVSNRDGNSEIYAMDADGSNRTNLTNNSAQDLSQSWSPDGGKIAFSSNRDGDFEIYVMDADGDNVTRLTTNSTHDTSPSWSPDGSRISFISRRDGSDELYVMNADGTGQTRFSKSGGPYSQRTLAMWFRTADDVATRQALWEEGGNLRGLSVYVDRGYVYVNGWNLVNDDGGATTPWGPKFARAAIDPNTLYHVALVLDQPTDRLTGFLNGKPFGEASGIGGVFGHIGDVNIGRIGDATVFHDGDNSSGHFFRGLIDEVQLYDRALSASELTAIFDAEGTGGASAMPPPPGLVSRWAAEGNANDDVGSNSGVLLNGVGIGEGVVGQAFLLDGRDDFVAIPNSPAINAPAGLCCPTWSPDGGRIAFTSGLDGNDEIYVVGADGNGLRNLTRNVARDCCPAWSPDGTHIAFLSLRENADRDPAGNGNGAGNTDGEVEDVDIYLMRADGSDQARLIGSTGGDTQLEWSPDGRRIAFVSDRDRDHGLFVIDADGTGRRKLADRAVSNGLVAWSPDSRLVAFTAPNADIANSAEIHVVDVGGTARVRLTEGGDGGLISAAYVDSSWPHAAGALSSTVEDLYLWDQALRTEELLGKGSLDTMFTPFAGSYGYGWSIDQLYGRNRVSHGGSIEGFQAYITRFVDDDIVIIVLANTESSPVERIGLGLADILFAPRPTALNVRVYGG